MRITDDGCGIPPADIERAMTRFVQLGESGSTGLGLSIVRAIVEGHVGTLGVRSSEGGLDLEIRLCPVAETARTSDV